MATVYAECGSMGIGFAALWNTFKRITANCSANEKSNLFSGTVRRAYRLE